MNTRTYYVDYPRDSAYRTEVEVLAREAVSAYANFISGDLPEGELRDKIIALTSGTKRKIRRIFSKSRAPWL